MPDFFTRRLPEIDLELCISCGACGAVCKSGVMTSDTGPAVLADPAGCTLCAACEDVCPAGAISVPFRIEYSDRAVFHITARS